MSMGYQQQPRAGGVKPPSGQKTQPRATSSSSGNVVMSQRMQSNMTKRISGAKEKEPDFIEQLSTFMVSNQSAAEKTQKLEESVTVQRSTINSQRKLLEQYRSNNTVLKDQLSLCNLKISNSEKLRVQLTERYRGLKATLDSTKAIVEADNEKLQGLLDWKRMATDQLDKGDLNVKGELIRLEKILSDQKRKIDELKADVTSREEELKKAADEHASKQAASQQESKELKDELDACKIKLQKTSSDLESSSKNLQMMQESYKMSETSVTEHKEKIKIAEANVKKGIEAVVKLERNLTETSRKLEASDKSLLECKRHADIVKSDLDSSANKVVELERTIKAQADAFKSQAAEMDKLKQEKSTESEQLHSKIGGLEDNIKRCGEDISDCNDALTLERDKVKGLEERVCEVENLNESLTQQVSQAGTSACESIKKLQADKKASDAEVARFKKELAKHNKEAAKRDEATEKLRTDFDKLQANAAKHNEEKTKILDEKNKEIEELKVKSKSALDDAGTMFQKQLDDVNKKHKETLEKEKQARESIQKNFDDATEKLTEKVKELEAMAKVKESEAKEKEKSVQTEREEEKRQSEANSEKARDDLAAAKALVESVQAQNALLTSSMAKMQDEALAAQRAPPTLLLSAPSTARTDVSDPAQLTERSSDIGAAKIPRHALVAEGPVKPSAPRKYPQTSKFQKKIKSADSSKVAPLVEKLAPSGSGSRTAGSSMASSSRAAASDVEIPNKAGSSKRMRGTEAVHTKAKKQKQKQSVSATNKVAASIGPLFNTQKPSAACKSSSKRSSSSNSSQVSSTSSDLDIFN